MVSWADGWAELMNRQDAMCAQRHVVRVAETADGVHVRVHVHLFLHLSVRQHVNQTVRQVCPPPLFLMGSQKLTSYQLVTECNMTCSGRRECACCAPYATRAISSVKVGTHALDTTTQPTPVPLGLIDYVSDDGSSNGFAVTGVTSDYDLVSDEAEQERLGRLGSDGSGNPGMTWTCTDDGEAEPEVSLTVTQFAELYRKAKAYDHLETYCIHIANCHCE